MNFFKNPVVVSVLAVLAVVLVFDRVVWPLMKHGGTPQQTLATAAAVKSLPSTPSAPTAQKTAANPSGAGENDRAADGSGNAGQQLDALG